mgnify:CR=1 FL=1|jgi:DNA-binding response OmpR family regulator
MEKLRVLLVDDIGKVRSLLRGGLRRDYIVHTAKNERKALELLEKYSYDLVITDEDLGGETHREGEKVIREAKKLNYLRPVLAMSRENCERGMLEAGADCFVFKKELLDYYCLR